MNRKFVLKILEELWLPCWIKTYFVKDYRISLYKNYCFPVCVRKWGESDTFGNIKEQR